MSRFLKIMIVLLTIAAVATPVMAEDRLSLGGQMRVRGWYLDDERANDNNTSSFMDQRLRIGGKFNIAEGVSVTFRFDETESAWGDQPGNGAGRLVSSDNPMQWDRAYFDITKGMFHLRGGLHSFTWGRSAFDAQDNGLYLDINTPVKVSLFWSINDNNNGSVYSNKANYNSDAYYYGAKVGFKADGVAADGYVVGQKGDTGGTTATAPSLFNEEVYVIGANGKFDLNAVKLEVELDYFTGDAATELASDSKDAIGTQLFVDASVAASEAFTVGAQLYYALGTDDADEAQYYCLGNEFNGWDSLFILGTGLDNEKAGMGRPFDLGKALSSDGEYGSSTGIMAIRGYASFKASDDLTLSGSLAYAEPEEDSNTDLDSAVLLGVGVAYDLMSNVQLTFQGEYKAISADETTNDSGDQVKSDPNVLTGGVALFVNF